MWYATISFSHPDGWFHSVGEAFAEHDAIAPVAIHSSRLLDDGTAVVLYELEGDADMVRAVLSADDDIRNYRVSEFDSRVAAYYRFEPTPTIRSLLSISKEYGIVVDGPMTFYEDGSLEVSLVGPQELVSEAYAQTPDTLSTTVEHVGSYAPGETNRTEKLTERQREVLRTAYELGYYRTPRTATLDDIAAELGCSHGNAQEILRRVENQLVADLFKRVDVTEHEPPPLRSVW